MSKEPDITDKLLGLFRKTDVVKKVSKGESLPKSAFKDVLEWYKSIAPAISVTPDLILVFEKNLKEPEEALLVAVECKYFLSEKKERLRRAFREVGQPLRNLIFGYDLVILWHLFAEEINGPAVKNFVKICNEVIEGLNLPMVYFATKILYDEKFRVYSPCDFADYINNTYKYINVEYIARSIRDAFEERYNPLLTQSEVMHRRKAIKTALNIP